MTCGRHRIADSRRGSRRQDQPYEIGTAVIDMCYEYPLYMVEEAGAADLIAGGRLQLGISRGSPELVIGGWSYFGYPRLRARVTPTWAGVVRRSSSTCCEARRPAPIQWSGQPSSQQRGRLGKSDGRTGGKHSVGGSKRRCSDVPSLLSLPESEAARASGESARAAEVRGSNPLSSTRKSAQIDVISYGTG
jgi:hypothetical protein